MIAPAKALRPHLDVEKAGTITCPKCQFSTRVLDSRLGPKNSVRRRRSCCSSLCLHRFTTYEVTFADQPLSAEALVALVDGVAAAGQDLAERLAKLTEAAQANAKLASLEP